ncbi:MAG: HAD-IB family hydrolase [Proteobacteria bacterium]|nr:HAD-IB family hydrolase [Pseudomonadota bacterium]
MAKGKKPETIVIFDLDRTLTRSGTFTPYLLNLAGEEPAKYLYVFAVLFRMALYVLGVISRKQLKEYMLHAFMAGMSRSEADKQSKDFYNKLFRKGFHQDGLAALEAHRKKGHLVGVATAAMDFYVERIVKELGLDFMIATTSVWEKRVLIPVIKGENCYGAEKARRVREFLAARKYGEVWFYSDHHSDAPAFRLADIKVAVNPTHKLKKLARAGGFQIEHWR